jgi:DNA-directed RNA polymerase subunit RPC12/RpoP
MIDDVMYKYVFFCKDCGKESVYWSTSKRLRIYYCPHCRSRRISLKNDAVEEKVEEREMEKKISKPEKPKEEV